VEKEKTAWENAEGRNGGTIILAIGGVTAGRGGEAPPPLKL